MLAMLNYRMDMCPLNSDPLIPIATPQCDLEVPPFQVQILLDIVELALMLKANLFINKDMDVGQNGRPRGPQMLV